MVRGKQARDWLQVRGQARALSGSRRHTAPQAREENRHASIARTEQQTLPYWPAKEVKARHDLVVR